MGKRKTIEIEKLVDFANEQLRYSVLSSEFRDGVRSLVERALCEAGRYGGFRYLTIDEVPKGSRPGVRVKAEGGVLPPAERFADTDRTRVEYFLKK